MKRRQRTGSEMLALLNAAPKTNYDGPSGRETLSTFKQEQDRKLAARQQAELEASLEPIKREQAQLLKQLQDKQRRETRISLMMRPSPDFEAPLYEGNDSPEIIQQNITVALRDFLQNEGLGLSDADRRLLRDFMRENTQHKQFDLTKTQTWALGQRFIESKLNPVEPEQTEIDRTIETDWIPEREVLPEVPETTADLRNRAEHEWVKASHPVFDAFRNRVLLETGHPLSEDEQRKLIAFVQQRNLKGDAPQSWMTALYWTYPDYLPHSERLEIEERRDRNEMPMDEYKRKYNLVVNNPCNRSLIANENARG